MKIDGKLREWIPGNKIATFATEDAISPENSTACEPYVLHPPFLVQIEFQTEKAAIEFVNSVED